MEELPGQGHYLAVSDNGRTRPYGVTSIYIPVGLGDDAIPHVFATLTSAPYQEAERVGISEDDRGMPSLTSFDGRTVADLMVFLSHYPAEMEIGFQNDEVLVAQPKDVLRLRLNPAESSHG